MKENRRSSLSAHHKITKVAVMVQGNPRTRRELFSQRGAKRRSLHWSELWVKEKALFSLISGGAVDDIGLNAWKSGTGQVKRHQRSEMLKEWALILWSCSKEALSGWR